MRGDFVTIAMQGDFGKPRPALVIQADAAWRAHHRDGVAGDQHACCRSAAADYRSTWFRERVAETSQVMVDKAMTVRRDKLGQAFGRIDGDAMVEVERCLAVFLGIAK